MWKTVPNMTFLETNKKGKVRNCDDLVRINEYVNQKGYVVVRIKSPYGDFIRMKHRLIGRTHLKDFKESNDINHIDTNKLNNNITNLESITHKENMMHAVQNKLLQNQHSVRVYKKGLLIKECVSLIDVSKLLKVTPYTLIPRIKASKEINIYPDIHLEINGDLDKVFDVRAGKTNRVVFVYDSITDSLMEYKSLSRCSYEIMIPLATLSVMLNKRHKLRHSFKGYFISDKPIDKHTLVINKKQTLTQRIETNERMFETLNNIIKKKNDKI